MLPNQGQVPALLGSLHHGPLPDSRRGPALPEAMNCSTSAELRRLRLTSCWNGWSTSPRQPGRHLARSQSRRPRRSSRPSPSTWAKAELLDKSDSTEHGQRWCARRGRVLRVPLVGGVLRTAAGAASRHLLGLRSAEPQGGGVLDHLVVLLGDQVPFDGRDDSEPPSAGQPGGPSSGRYRRMLPTTRLLDAVRGGVGRRPDQPPVILVGASGMGRSSLLPAGLERLHEAAGSGGGPTRCPGPRC